MTKTLFLTALLAYVACNLGLTVGAVRADRAGDAERALAMRTAKFRLLLGTIGVFAVAGCVTVLVAIAAR